MAIDQQARLDGRALEPHTPVRARLRAPVPARLRALGLATCALAALLCAARGSAQGDPGGTSSAATALTPYVDEMHTVPLREAQGRAVALQARVCRALTPEVATLVVINHGTYADRSKAKPGRCSGEAAQWFLRRGYVVMFPLRRGYGDSAGEWVEADGRCQNPNHLQAGIETARDIDAAVKYGTSLPFVKPAGVIVVGQSAGGWGTIAYAASPHERVAAYVVFAAGRGGHARDVPNSNCRPDLLVAAAGRFGRTATTPMLWIYAQNDSFFDPALAHALWEAFTRNGGKADLEQLDPYGTDGHYLLFGPQGSLIWGPIVEKYLLERGATAH